MIRVAIVGTHMRAYLELKERCRVAALVDIIPGKARRIMEEFGLRDGDGRRATFGSDLEERNKKK